MRPIHHSLVGQWRSTRWAKCSHPWHFSFHHAGVEHRYSLDKLARARGQEPPVGKSEAVTWRDRLRTEIRAGELTPDTSPAPSAVLTVGDVAERYLETFVGKREKEGQVEWTGQHLRPRSAVQADYQIRLARACEVPAAGGTMRFEHKPIDLASKADLEAIRTARRTRGVIGANRLLARLRHLFNWAIAEGFAEQSPFKRQGVCVVRLETQAETPRTRRLEPGDEERLLKHAGPHLRALIVAALTTGCRVGELLSLQWHQIRYDEQGKARWMVLPAAKTKTKTGRVLPIGPRLGAELAMRRHAVDGKDHPPSAYVFGDDAGEPIKSIKRAWEATVLRAHGHKVTRVKGKPGRLSAESRAALREINLHFHDLRRQFACTLIESSADLHDVRDFLGHANITTTSRYLASSPVRLARALDRLDPEPPDEKETDDATTGAPENPIRTPFAQSTEAANSPIVTTSDKLLN